MVQPLANHPSSLAQSGGDVYGVRATESIRTPKN